MKSCFPIAFILAVMCGAVTATMVSAAPPQTVAPVATPVVLRAGKAGPLGDLQLSGDGKTAFVTYADAVEIYDLTTRKLAQKIKLGQVGRTLAVAADANSQSGQFAVRLSPFGTLIPTFPPPPDSIEVKAYPATQQLKPTSATGMAENDLGFARDGKMFAVITDNAETTQTANYDNYFVVIYDQDGKVLANVDNQREGNTWFGVKSLSFSPDGTRLMVGWSHSVLAIYDTSNLKPPATKEIPVLPVIAVLPGHEGGVTQLDWSQDGRLLASGDSKGLVQLWDWASQKNVGRWNVTYQRIFGLSIAPDNASVAIAVESKKYDDAGTVQSWDVASGTATKVWKPPLSALQVVWTDGQTLLVGDEKGGLTLVPIAAFEPFRATPPAPIDLTKPFLELSDRQSIHEMSWSRDGRWLASVGYTNLRLLDMKSGALVRVPQHPREQITDVEFSPDSALLATSGHGDTEVVELATQTLLWRRPSGAAVIAGWSRDGATIYLAEFGGQIAAFEARSGHLQRIIGHVGSDYSRQVLSARLSPDGTRIAVTVLSAHKEDLYANDFYDSTLEVWEVASAKRLWQVTVTGKCDAMDWTPDSKWLVAKVGDFSHGHRYSNGQMLFVPGKIGANWFDATTGKADAARSRMDSPQEIEALEFSPTGKTLAVALRGAKAQLWDDMGRFKRELSPSQGDIAAWAFSSDGKHLAAGGQSMPLRFWTPIGGF